MDMIPNMRTISTTAGRGAGHRPHQSYDGVQVAAYCGVAVLLTAYIIDVCLRLHILATDFHHEFWPAAHLVTSGVSPYQGSWQHISSGVAFPYPALTALVFVPFALLPHGVADGVFTAVNIGAVLGTLRVLQIKDRRLYGLVLMWPVVVQAWQTANLTLVLGLGIAWLWRKRDQPVVAGALVAVMVSLKPFIWPLGLWLLVTRRYMAAAYAIASGLAINVIAFAVLGFGQWHRYEHVARAVTNVMYKRGYDLVALAMHLGAGHRVAYAVAVAVAAFVAVACVYVGRRGKSQTALTLCIALSLLATPVLWAHYFALMVVPLALARPRLSALWFLPLAMWVCPVVKPAPWQSILALGVNVALVLAITLRPAPKPAHDELPESSDARAAGHTPGTIAALVTK